MKNLQISLCIPSSVISYSNACNLQHITHIAYQIAKAAAIYNVVEIVTLEVPSKKLILNQLCNAQDSLVSSLKYSGNKRIKFSDVKNKTGNQPRKAIDADTLMNDSNGLLFANLLQFFVTPRYLLKSVFRNNHYTKKFVYARKLPTLCTLPFMNHDGTTGNFKEGFTVSKQSSTNTKKSNTSSSQKRVRATTYVNVGNSELLKLCGPEVPTNVRVTVDLKKKLVVSPELAYGGTAAKTSFGFLVRHAKTVTSVFTEQRNGEGYTETIFVNADDYFGDSSEIHLPEKITRSHGRILLVIGNLRDLTHVFEQENAGNIDSVADLFDAQITVPSGLRIEDATFVSLTKVKLSGFE